MARRCPSCAIFAKDGWTVENAADEPATDQFPDEFSTLIPYSVKRDGEYAACTLQCPACGRLYEYTRSLPGGSYDAMRTWVVERLVPVTKRGLHVQKSALGNPPDDSDAGRAAVHICLGCRSGVMQQVGSSTIGGEVFFQFRCSHCGHEDVLDENQIQGSS